MLFPFTFTLNVPGLQNPFLAQPGLMQNQSRIDSKDVQTPTLRSARPPRRISPSPTLSPPVPLVRKRGWVPSTPEPSRAATSATCTKGYLDTPAKYRDMPQHEPEQETEEMFGELPPAKRRRTLAGSIVSTALSAALIGTAVGLTVYRLIVSWRDRGKEPGPLPPPPPYQRGDWVPSHQEPVTPPTPNHRRPRPAPTSARRPVARHPRKARARIRPVTPPRGMSPALMSPPRPEFDFVHINDHPDEVGSDPEPETDEMDWIGDRLSRLIEEGQKALGREIVVMSDSKEDEVDDGSGEWEEEGEGDFISAPSISRRGSIRSLRRTHRPHDLSLPPSDSAYAASPPSSASPRKRRFDTESIHRSPGRSAYSAGLPVPSTPRRIGRGPSVESDAFHLIPSSFREDEGTWQSPELRESMERARALYLQKRSQ
ncbi:hypothetical protein BU15DRAFT_42223 [Melanogaster broomeanus]|nr:hypothetical protein BU15DRAFT_42223 [Melanogaster broomeanus]